MVARLGEDFMDAVTYLKGLGVADFSLGFQDSAQFRALERENPSLLDWHAAYVDEQQYSRQYLAKAKRKISELADFIYRRLAKDGRIGACVDASAAFGRMLEREGIWNYVVKGGAAIYPAVWTHIEPFFYYPISPPSGATAPHSWVVAPPFRVVDLTIKLQPHLDTGVNRVLPDYILSETTKRVEPGIGEWLDPDLLLPYANYFGRLPTIADLPAMIGEEVTARANKFGSWEVVEKRASFHYTVAAMGGAEALLEGIRSFNLSGNSALEVYEEFVAKGR